MQETLTLISGANQGMGYETAKELGQHGQHVLIGSRNPERGQQAVDQLRKLDIKADAIELDVTSQQSINQAAQFIEKTYGYLSILINNAGIAVDKHLKPSLLSTETMRKDFDVNFFGLVDVTQAMVPLLKKSENAKIINVSSMMGSLTASTTPGYQTFNSSAAGYQSSKAAVNMFSVQLAKELQEDKITVNMVDPGMVATAFGSGDPAAAKAHGARPVEEGVARTVALALSDDSSITGTYSNNDGIVPW